MNLTKARFTEMLIQANGLDPDEFQSWVFCPGMLFNSPDKWWGDRGRRDFPHEGVDFCLYRDNSGCIARLDRHTRLPAMHSGTVRAMFRDYLGQAVIIEHNNAAGKGDRRLSVYAHTQPRDHIRPGCRVAEGEIIATIADTSRSRAGILPHLHYSLGHPSPDLVYEPFVWNYMRDPDRVALLDPLEVVDWPCQVIQPGHTDQNACLPQKRST